MISVYITHSTGETTVYQFALAEGVQFRIGRDTSCEISLPEETFACPLLHIIHKRTAHHPGQSVKQRGFPGRAAHRL